MTLTVNDHADAVAAISDYMVNHLASEPEEVRPFLVDGCNRVYALERYVVLFETIYANAEAVSLPALGLGVALANFCKGNGWWEVNKDGRASAVSAFMTAHLGGEGPVFDPEIDPAKREGCYPLAAIPEEEPE